MDSHLKKDDLGPRRERVKINIFGSSHITKSHKFPQIFKKELEASPSVSKKFTIGEIKGFSGGRLFNNDLVMEIVEVAKSTAAAPQIIVLLLGSNDWANFQMTSQNFEARYASVIDKFLEIPGAGVLLANLPPRGRAAWKRKDMSEANKIIRVMAQSYQKQVHEISILYDYTYNHTY